MDTTFYNELLEILNDLKKIDGIEGCLISDLNGNIICHTMTGDNDISLFGSMGVVISGSSKRLLSFTDQGEIQRVLIESENGKALFLHLSNVQLILIMEINANIGLVLVSAKKNAPKIINITENLVFEEPDQGKPSKEEGSELEIIIKDSSYEEDKIEVVEEIAERIEYTPDEVVGPENLDEIIESSEFEAIDTTEADEQPSDILVNNEIESNENVEIDKHQEIKEEEDLIPVIKPPISFPRLPEDVKLPENKEERVELILDIYESIFLAMSIGASKIMGVAPAKGLLKQFLPQDEFKDLLNDVDVKNNSVIDFDKIRENCENITVDKKDERLISDFNEIIHVITENYGKVMGYEAFRGIVRTEFIIISDSYGNTMEDLEIIDKIHPELKELFK